MFDIEKLAAIQPSKVTRILGFIVTLLVSASIAGHIIKFTTGNNYIHGFVVIFDVNREYNIPAGFSAVILLIAAFLLSTIAVFKKRKGAPYALHWIILAVIFMYLSIDEAVCIHERFNPSARDMFGTGWLPYYAWVIPGSAFVLFFALSYFRFLLHLPMKSRRLFSIAAILYIGGALGIEIAGYHYVALYGPNNLTYNMIGTVEETLEMVGIILFIYALLDYISLNVQEIRLHAG